MERMKKDILGGEYTVYSDGRVFSNKSHKFLRISDNGHGYLTVCICTNGTPRTEYVHRLVAEAFVSNPEGLPEVNHKDEDKANNAADNLEWCTPKYNKNYGSRAEKFGKSRGRPVRCVETDETYYCCGDAERKTGIRRNGIWACCAGYRQSTAGGFHWVFA